MRVVLSSSEHNHSYQTALALHDAGILERFVTGIYNDSSWERIRVVRAAVERFGSEGDRLRLAGRRQPGLPSGSVIPTAVWLELIEQAWRRSPALRSTMPANTLAYFRSELLDLQVAARHIRECDVFHGFDGCAKFSLQRARRHKLTTVLDEPIIHPGLLGSTEVHVCAELGVPLPHRAPGYAMAVERKYRELELADYLLVGLRFVKRSYVAAGFPEDRVFVVPYGADTSRFRLKDRAGRKGPLRILFVGQVSWFKGLHHLLDVFEALPIEATLTVIGSVHEEWSAFFTKRFASLSKPVDYLQTVPNLEMERYFEEADVFVFPSLVGGIGLAVYEAMASGLPVVTSDGDVVIRDGIDGLVAGVGVKDAWIKALVRLHEEPSLRLEFGERAAERIREFTWSSYRQRVRAAYERIERDRDSA